MADIAKIVLHVYDGTRQLLPNTVRVSVKTRDGQVPVRDFKLYPDFQGGAVILDVPFFDNFGDMYTVIVNADGYEDAAWYPVHVNDKMPVTLELMMLPKGGGAHFENATWDKLTAARKGVADIVARGCDDAVPAGDKYQAVLEARPDALACFLNIMTALGDMTLPSGKPPLNYYWNIAWPAGDPRDPAWVQQLDATFKQDRFFCYVDQAILPDVRAGVKHGFAQEPNPQAWGHSGATESYKQTSLDVCNVQWTFHGHDTATFTDEQGNSIDCLKIEPDIDYFRDVGAHALMEVIPNLITKGLTDPKVVYALRWMAVKREGHGEFDPLFTVQP